MKTMNIAYPVSEDKDVRGCVADYALSLMNNLHSTLKGKLQKVLTFASRAPKGYSEGTGRKEGSCTYYVRRGDRSKSYEEVGGNYTKKEKCV